MMHGCVKGKQNQLRQKKNQEIKIKTTPRLCIKCLLFNSIHRNPSSLFSNVVKLSWHLAQHTDTTELDWNMVITQVTLNVIFYSELDAQWQQGSRTTPCIATSLTHTRGDLGQECTWAEPSHKARPKVIEAITESWTPASQLLHLWLSCYNNSWSHSLCRISLLWIAPSWWVTRRGVCTRLSLNWLHNAF